MLQERWVGWDGGDVSCPIYCYNISSTVKNPIWSELSIAPGPLNHQASHISLSPGKKHSVQLQGTHITTSKNQSAWKFESIPLLVLVTIWLSAWQNIVNFLTNQCNCRPSRNGEPCSKNKGLQVSMGGGLTDISFKVFYFLWFSSLRYRQANSRSYWKLKRANKISNVVIDALLSFSLINFLIKGTHERPVIWNVEWRKLCWQLTAFHGIICTTILLFRILIYHSPPTP